MLSPMLVRLAWQKGTGEGRAEQGLGGAEHEVRMKQTAADHARDLWLMPTSAERAHGVVQMLRAPHKHVRQLRQQLGVPLRKQRSSRRCTHMSMSQKRSRHPLKAKAA